MQLKRPWTIIGGVTAAVVVGASGFAMASDDNGRDDLSGAISLKDRVSVSETHTPAKGKFEIVPMPVLGADSNDSPFSANAGGVGGSNDSPSAEAWNNLAGTGDTFDSFSTPNDAFDSGNDSYVAPAPAAPAYVAPAPAPVYNSPDDSPDYVAPAPAPAPVYNSPDDSPDYVAPAPAPANDSFDSASGAGSFDSVDGS